MYQCGTISLLLLLLTAFPLLYGQQEATTSSSVSSTSESSIIYDPNAAYCFEFTWLGPDYDNTMQFNKTCEDWLTDTNNDKYGLCRQPFVITNDSTVPDTVNLFQKHKHRVIRPQRKGQVCARWSYRFNNEVMNITYMRTKVFVENEGPVLSGCYKQMHGSYEAELCVCEPQPGEYQPCNAAASIAHLRPPPLAAVNARLVHLAIATLACTLLTRWLI